MTKPRVFISSTIHDFADLRSALKYWLEEAGCYVQMSEYADFEKDSAANSYEACLETIATCDFFILLVGSRKGGLYDDKISITRREYREAYELFKQGKIKKIVNLVRKSVLDAIEDRKATKSAEPSKILEDDPEHIISFVREISRIDDMKKGESPQGNWVAPFSGFADIVDTVRIALGLNISISELNAKSIIKLAVLKNLQELYRKSDSGVKPFYDSFLPIREMLINQSVKPSPQTDTTIKLCMPFFNLYKTAINRLNTFIFDDAISNGVFLKYDATKLQIEPTNFHRALMDLSSAIKIVREISPSPIFKSVQQKVVTDNGNRTIVSWHGESRSNQVIYDIVEYWKYNAIYERLADITALSAYLLQCISNSGTEAEYPELFINTATENKPSENELLEFLQGEAKK